MDSVEEIWREYHTRLHAFIRSRVGDASDAEDILQDVFLRIHSRVRTLEDGTRLQSWMYQIARNAIVDYYRARKTTAKLPESLTSPEPDAAEEARQDIARCFSPLIESLPEHYREAVTMSEIEGLTQQEVAERQGLSLSGAKSRVQRGRAMVKDALLQCCQLEFDQRGRMVDYDDNGSSCERC